MSLYPNRAENSASNKTGAVARVIEPAGGCVPLRPVSVAALFFGHAHQGKPDSGVGECLFTAANWLAYLRWLREELVNALVRPVFARVMAAHRWGGLPVQIRFARRFEQLVDALDCWPCRIDWDWSTGSLTIYSGPFDDEIFDLPEGAHFA